MTKPVIIYCFPGQGSDAAIFGMLKVAPPFQLKVVAYGTPGKMQSLKAFATELSRSIDTSGEFILLGHSLGGMICAELAELTHPLLTIIISGAKNRNEFPMRYRFQRYLPLYRIVPGFLLLAGAKILQPLVEPESRQNRDIFRKMLNTKNGLYMRRSIAMLMRWERVSNTKKIIAIHGDRDRTLPIKNIRQPDHIIRGGSHMIILTRADEINELLRKILSDLVNSR